MARPTRASFEKAERRCICRRHPIFFPEVEFWDLSLEQQKAVENSHKAMSLLGHSRMLWPSDKHAGKRAHKSMLGLYLPQVAFCIKRGTIHGRNI